MQLIAVLLAVQAVDCLRTLPVAGRSGRARLLAATLPSAPRLGSLGANATAAAWDDATDNGPFGKAVDDFLTARFRSSLAAANGGDSDAAGYRGIIALITALHGRKGSTPADVTRTSRAVLQNCFPDWPPGAPDGKVGLLYWFDVLFARNFLGFAEKLNAWVTWWAAQWLMGTCTLEDVAEEDMGSMVGGLDGRAQLLRVHRCRYLEESQCASICVNTCKMPTQAFFNEDMGVPMVMEPNYDTLECKFKFGVRPSPADEAEARATPCFATCDQRSLRTAHRGAAAEAEERCVSMGGDGDNDDGATPPPDQLENT